MRQDIQRHFTALGLSPGASANDIRAAYRKLIQEWHPDRFAVGSLMQTTAEDHTKELNEAYEWLYKKRHYRKYLGTAARARPVARPAAGPEEKEAETKPPKTSRPAPRPFRWPSLLRSRRGWKIAALAVGLAASACIIGFLLRSRGPAPGRAVAAAAAPAPDSPSLAAALPPSTAASAAPVAAGAPAAAPFAGGDPVGNRIQRSEVERVAPLVAPKGSALDVRPRSAMKRVEGNALHPLRRDGEVLASSAGAIPISDNKLQEPPAAPSENFLRTEQPAAAVVSGAEWDQRLDASEAELDTFEMGDSLERVKIVQGTPDETTTGAFRYGSSLVFFEKGKVSGWINGVPRLRIPLLSFADLQDEIDAITLGSTRGEVFRIQGMPDGVSGDAYTYGTNAVFFKGDRVVNWIRTDERLRTRFLPELPFFDRSLGNP